ncbi:hypothetical protein FHX09_001479 [Rhizobium sp. BK538]|nr:hypothetical protein [Rhizobium sp. BK060]MBB4167648.1 hypothetical protein [Rhizobium sp. BK538]
MKVYVVAVLEFSGRKLHLKHRNDFVAHPHPHGVYRFSMTSGPLTRRISTPSSSLNSRRTAASARSPNSTLPPSGRPVTRPLSSRTSAARRRPSRQCRPMAFTLIRLLGRQVFMGATHNKWGAMSAAMGRFRNVRFGRCMW